MDVSYTTNNSRGVDQNEMIQVNAIKIKNSIYYAHYIIIKENSKL